MIGLQQARPPYIEFKQVAVHDTNRSLELGYRVTKDVDMAFIMQPGSKDCLEIEAKAWLDSVKRKALEGTHDAYPDDWVQAFHRKYEAWKAGQEAPLDGTSVKEWPMLSPAQVQNFLALSILTIEDVAAMTEEAMQRMGMGARDLRDKAREWLKGKEVAKFAMEENAALKQQIAELKQQLDSLTEAKPRRAGRPKKTEVN